MDWVMWFLAGIVAVLVTLAYFALLMDWVPLG